MAISNELSSDIAAAILLAGATSSVELEGLKRVVQEVHETLERMRSDPHAREVKPRSYSASAAQSTGSSVPDAQ